MKPPDQRNSFKHRKAVYQTDWQLLKRIRKLLLSLGILLGLHCLAMVWFEGMTWEQAIWLTLTTLTTVGYGDLSAQTASGQVATIVLVYITAITMVTLIISDYIDYRFLRREKIRLGKWKWNMIDHILIINSPHQNTEQYFQRLVKQLRDNEEYHSTPIQILTDQFPDGLPLGLSELGVTHYHGSPDNQGDLSAVNAHTAKHILILAKDDTSTHSDGTTFDILHRLMEYNLSHLCVVECVRDENRVRMQKLGPKTIIRPVRAYPEIIITSMLAPGSEKVLEDLITHDHDHPCRYDVRCEDITWSDIVCALIKADQGTAMAYINTNNEEVVIHPRPDTRINCIGLIILVKTDNKPTQTDIQESLLHYKNRKQKWDNRQKALEEGDGEKEDGEAEEN